MILGRKRSSRLAQIGRAVSGVVPIAVSMRREQVRKIQVETTVEEGLVGLEIVVAL